MGYHGLEKLYNEQRQQKKETIEDVYYYQEVNNPYAVHQTITVQKVRCPDKSEYICVHCEDDEEGWGYIYLSKEEAMIMAENILKSLNNNTV